MKEKDRKFIIDIFELDESGYEKLIGEVKSVSEKGEENLDDYINGLTENLPGRDAYEVKKILVHRLD
ncbi:MAG: hypothetical protein C0601_01430 [Candidatus Muiribacterium halophilum]|uniref:Uncharacterized protein n=1 Tax=Muiribacterium halophilum TaxID=2053465 RepID=A0A2N5ZLK3_MUIH1|nr:MAG: hypothetical protein C0601_01430 [Candidatus Muirbacterium halophilum]